MHPRLRSLLAFLLLLAGSFLTYHYAIADTPRRDHLIYLAERALLETDWDWFWHSVSHSRARLIKTYDYYFFRPLHMAVLALKDIFFRSNLFALGAINITTMAVAAFSLYLFSSRLLRPAVAFIVALLFMVQYAGLEMVAWGHINPYLLALAFFGFAMASLLETGPDNKGPLKKAGALLLLGMLVHEMVVVALVFSAPVLLFVRWRAGKGAEIGGIPLGSYILWVVAFPVMAYAGLNLFDYIYHGATSLLGLPDEFLAGGRYGPLGAVLTVVGAPVVAFLAPFTVELAPGTTGILAWQFESIRPIIHATGTVMGLAVVLGFYWCIRAIKRGSGSRIALPALLVLLMFVGIAVGVGMGRVFIKGTIYLSGATYYYSITAYLFCLLTAMGLYHLDTVRKGKISPLLSKVILVAMVALIAVNFAKTRETLGRDWPKKAKTARMYFSLNEVLAEHSQRYCLAGSAAFADVFMQLLRERTCQQEDGRIPGYMVTANDGSVWLAELEAKPFDAFGEPRKVETEAVTQGFMKGFMMSRDSYNRPDVALTVHNRPHTWIAFGYKSPVNFFYVDLYGSFLQGKYFTGKEHRPFMQSVGLPYAGPVQRLELRRGANVIYIFVDGHLAAAAPDLDKGPGKIGFLIREVEETDGNTEKTFSDFMVAPSAPRGEKPVAFNPVLRLLEGSDVAFPMKTPKSRIGPGR